MNIVVAVDWRDQSQPALNEIVDLYKPHELTLVHAVHPGDLNNPPSASVMDHEAYQEFERAKQRFMDQAEEQLQQLAAHVQRDVPVVKPVSAAGDPENVILQVVASIAADLVVVGHRGLGQFAGFSMGSVSHLVLLHVPCATLVVKGAPTQSQRVIVVVKGPDDAARITAWLLAHPFQQPRELVVLNVVPLLSFEFLKSQEGVESWTQAVVAAALCCGRSRRHGSCRGHGCPRSQPIRSAGGRHPRVHGCVSLPVRKYVALSDASRGGIGIGGALTSGERQLGLPSIGSPISRQEVGSSWND